MAEIKRYITSGRFWLALAGTLCLYGTAYLGVIEYDVATKESVLLWGGVGISFGFRAPKAP